MAKVYGVAAADGLLMSVNVADAQVLCLCESKADAEKLLKEIKQDWTGEFTLFSTELDMHSVVKYSAVCEVSVAGSITE